jgi:hypothetical protein
VRRLWGIEEGATVNLARPVKVIIGVLTVWPFVYIMFFTFAVSWLTILSEGPSPTGSMPLDFRLLAATHLATILLMFGLIAFYIVFLFKTTRVAPDKKALWAVVLFLGNAVAMPVFFWLHVWPAQQSSTANR